MNSKKLITFNLFIALLILGSSCSERKEEHKKVLNESHPIIGTWKLISGTTIKGNDTVVIDYTQQQEMIKIINETHFAFLRHDLNKGQDSTAIFVAGGGKYFLKNNIYVEYLEYFNNRAWEGNSFEFEYTIRGDTLITKGVEKIEELKVDYFNIEKYCRVPQ
ncbi:hypothetical protein U6A24_11845 [Aquimarina gracilis]|uniref:Lipocalin-like protein n=1 Tax=Aquimarina gracilis TaxID=874422 RepID=A0ABU5ZWB1_9FLAO|nr:hypothetical protein [Aquimarina gracilis]MEB3346159.1 hypothetical protein [Aquimarina gracilis]